MTENTTTAPAVRRSVGRWPRRSQPGTNAGTRGRGLIAGAVTLTLTLVAAACGGGDGSGDEARGDASGAVELVTYDAFVLDDGAAEAFSTRHDREVEVLAQGDAGSVTSRAVLAAGNPEGDVLFGVDTTLLTRALDANLFEPLPQEVLELVPDRLRLEGPGADSVVAVDTGQVCVNADEAWFQGEGLEVPTSLEQLSDPAYRGLLVVQNAAASSPGLAFLLGTIDHFGEDAWQDYWKALVANDVRIAADWSDAYEAAYTVSGGDRPLVVSYGSSPPAEVVYSEGERTEPQSTVIEATCVEQVEYAGVLAGTERPEAARDLVAFLLSDDYQRTIPLANFVYPVTDVELPEVFVDFAVKAEDPLSLDAEEVAANRDRWTEEWRAITG
ncbi:MAG: thiamine ABC transporter substrate-binding protein [Microthrixaceae bacterium]